MKKIIFTSVRQILILTLILSVSISSFSLVPKKAEALAVPNTCALFDYYCIMDNLKEFTLNKLAVMVANQLLQRMTASVVNWINTGFEGSPTFLTNPEGFFLTAADQITGEFLYEAGALSQLCSPFSFDIRFNLAINQVNSFGTTYDCTLGKVIATTRNAVATAGQNSGVTLTGSSDGVSIGNFIDGDFSQGGYAGFLAYSTQPQNNPIGASLMARSDLQSKIAQKKTAVNTDLDRGQGFLSWQKCTDVTAGYTSGEIDAGYLGLNYADQQAQLRKTGNQDVITGKTELGKSTSVRKKVKRDSSGVNQVTYEQCRTETPGSIIGGSLQRQLNVPTDKLVLVKTISDSIDAMLGALMNQMLTQGLAALSDSGSSGAGSSRSYLSQLSEESYNRNSATAQSSRARAQNTSSSLANLAESSIATYDKSIALLNQTRNNYLAARSCFEYKLTIANLRNSDRAYAQGQIASINIALTQQIDPLLASTTVKKLEVKRQLGLYTEAVDAAAGGAVTQLSQSEIDEAFLRLENVISSASGSTQTGLEGANNGDQIYQSTLLTTTALDKTAATYQENCNEFPSNNRR